MRDSVTESKSKAKSTALHTSPFEEADNLPKTPVVEIETPNAFA